MCRVMIYKTTATPKLDTLLTRSYSAIWMLLKSTVLGVEPTPVRTVHCIFWNLLKRMAIYYFTENSGLQDIQCDSHFPSTHDYYEPVAG